MKNTAFRRILPLLSSVLLLIASAPSVGAQSEAAAEDTEAAAAVTDGGGYYAYLAAHPDGDRPDAEIRADIPTPVQIGEDDRATWGIRVPQAGFYGVRITYTAQAGKDIDIECGLLIDGVSPFPAAEAMPLSRVWKDSGRASYVDASGNEYLPVQEEVFREETAFLSARDEYVDGGYLFWFDEGEHRLTLCGERETFTVRALSLCQEPEAESYRQYLAGRDPRPVDAEPIVLEGEAASFRSHPTLYALADRSSCATSPYDAHKGLLNTIGGENWSDHGQWMEWDLTVKTAGFYRLSFRVKQNYKSGSFSVRKLVVDGKVPFAEAEDIRFVYGLGWAIVTMGGDEPQYLWLDEGAHTLRLEVAYGGFTEICAEIEDCVSQANALYRQIVMITGTSPDLLRDYRIGKLIPGCQEAFAALSDRLYRMVDRLEALVGKKGAEAASMEKLALQLSGFAEDTETAPRRLSTFSANISSLAAGLVSMAGQPLLLDYILLSPVGSALPAADAPWYRAVGNEVLRFFLSFIEDYDSIGSGGAENGEEAITLWLGIGRDQATVLYSLILSDLTAKTGIPVDLRLITQDIVMRAVAANKGPDLALFQTKQTVINYALRNAAYDLSTFSDFAEVQARFHPEAVKQYALGDGIYALPEQMNFDVMFVRTDVLAETGLSVPKTWDELYTVLAQLQRSHMQVGVTSSFTALSTSEMNPLFLSLLYQKGGEVYDADGRECLLDRPAGIEAFTQFCELYTKYGLPLKIDLLTHFRTGEAPVVINNVSFANELSVSAPELAGLWKMVPLPGTQKADGSIDNTTVMTSVSAGVASTASSSGVVMFSNAKDPENTWKLMKWWTDAQVQADYARQIEAALGRSGRWLSANLAAIEEVAWSKEELSVITGQLETLRCLPEVAGGYYTGRSVNNAVRTVVNDGKGGVSPKETLYEYVSEIDREILLKRKELKLD